MGYKQVLVGAALIVALAPSVSATVLLPGELGDIARSAAAIVRGTVVDVRSEWADGRRRVETIVTLRVSEAFKGDMTGLLELQTAEHLEPWRMLEKPADLETIRQAVLRASQVRSHR